MNTVCIIGAGPSGITAAKNCQQNGISYDIFEKNDKVGGNWVFNSATGHSSVYENTHSISSRTMSEYEDYPCRPPILTIQGMIIYKPTLKIIQNISMCMKILNFITWLIMLQKM